MILKPRSVDVSARLLKSPKQEASDQNTNNDRLTNSLHHVSCQPKRDNCSTALRRQPSLLVGSAGAKEKKGPSEDKQGFRKLQTIAALSISRISHATAKPDRSSPCLVFIADEHKISPVPSATFCTVFHLRLMEPYFGPIC